ncbi:MAG: cytochrome c, partial [Acidobacteriaceae bacterium]
MKTASLAHAVFLSALCVAATGCNHAPGKPPAVAEASRPDQVVDFPTLYKENCATCHGSDGKAGMVFSLSNPVYLAMSGEANI